MSDDEAPRPRAGRAPDTVTVVGIGADGWDGLGADAREALRRAGTVIGGPRQLALLPPGCTARRVPWPSPLRPAVPRLLAEHAGRRVAVLASGDPMFHGIGRTLARAVGAERLRVLPHASSVAYACARLGWAVEDTEVVSLVGRPAAALAAALHARRRLLVLSAGAGTPAEVAALLRDRGYGPSRMTVLEQLGAGARERRFEGTAAGWPHPPGDPLNVVAVECRPAPGGHRLSAVPGLPDAAYEHDGQLTKRHVRAAALAALAPSPGELLWDVGGGSGSVAVEWMRAGRGCRAVSVERDPVRAARIRRNAERLGVPALRVVTGTAPEALEGLAEAPADGLADGLPDGRQPGRGAGLGPPDAVFVGGGLTTPGLLEACWAALPAGGRLVANTVTLESEALLGEWHRRHGGELVRIAVSHAAPVGAFTGWRQAMPVTQWAVAKPGERGPGDREPDGPGPGERAPAE
ncbi:precorrin-6y C5,15-methyltransferase (decarboxylating) subunit CbiE [Streptomyces sp. F63]|uniref:precorrin-6y C5,15-methyltransferase (decarboxylating) subunit CbiE n=1 Tax=Streptomyces sp. F63 TaxID=2824887 RepID=UPI001B3972A4|nr:precorrin-6y C5,15-methyltransferase (decarboxylating) subunit CbiE [Streptomyces sp. F63]MBQ0984755.1 precorrin-6y C5,15-methyltransferase (decarboxylating) subunit CbiE [Streptomyces sp. F63]